MKKQQTNQAQLQLLSPITTHHNLFKNKNNNLNQNTNRDSPQKNKTSSSFQSNFKPNLKMKGERASIEGGNDKLRNIIQEEQNKVKPFSKKYISSQNSIYPKPISTPDSKQTKNQQPALSNPIIPQATPQVMNKTRDSFSKKLSSNIIKDQQSLYQKYKVQPDNRSPKLIKKQLISLNQQQSILQQQFMNLHKQNKHFLANIIQKYQLDHNRQKYYKGKDNQNQYLKVLQQRYRQNIQKLKRSQKIINKNSFNNFLKTMPQDIPQEQEQSQQQSNGRQVPQQQLRIDPSMGSYSISMSQVKDKKFKLNARRTYDYFKDNMRESKMTQGSFKDKMIGGSPKEKGREGNIEQMVEQMEEDQIDQKEDNRVTVNNKFKDFLLN